MFESANNTFSIYALRYIIWNASVSALFELLYGIAQPEPLYPYIMIISGGVLKNAKLPEIVFVLYMDIMIFLVISAVASTTFEFLFRYTQTVGSRLADWLSTWKIVVPVVAVVLAVCTATIVVPIHMLSYSGERIRKHFDLGVQDAVYGRLAVGFEVTTEQCRCSCDEFALARWLALKLALESFTLYALIPAQFSVQNS